MPLPLDNTINININMQALQSKYFILHKVEIKDLNLIFVIISS